MKVFYIFRERFCNSFHYYESFLHFLVTAFTKNVKKLQKRVSAFTQCENFFTAKQRFLHENFFQKIVSAFLKVVNFFHKSVSAFTESEKIFQKK